MFSRPLRAAACSALAAGLVACGSSGSTTAQAPIEADPALEAEPDWSQAATDETADPDGFEDPMLEMGAPAAPSEPEPETVKRTGPAPWTGYFSEKAIMVADTVRIEGPAGLLEHVVASSDDGLYERSIENTEEGLVQITRRMSDDVQEIRVQLDAWSMAVLGRLIVVERLGEGPVRVVADGEAAWRNVNGELIRGDRLEFTGEIGNDAPFVPQTAPLHGLDATPIDEADATDDDGTDTEPMDSDGSGMDAPSDQDA
ncbi:MAG: hypothetical protein AAGB93_20240 [Planctomycetota bacterium]